MKQFLKDIDDNISMLKQKQVLTEDVKMNIMLNSQISLFETFRDMIKTGKIKDTVKIRELINKYSDEAQNIAI